MRIKFFILIDRHVFVTMWSSLFFLLHKSKYFQIIDCYWWVKCAMHVSTVKDICTSLKDLFLIAFFHQVEKKTINLRKKRHLWNLKWKYSILSHWILLFNRENAHRKRGIKKWVMKDRDGILKNVFNPTVKLS